MVSSVSDSSAQIWLRTPQAASVRVVLADGDKKTVEESAETSAASDFTAVIKFGSLQSNTQYEYRLFVNDKKVALPYSSRFRTWPKRDNGVKFSFAFGGGAGYVTGHAHMWDTIGKSKPAVLFLLGDNMNSDAPESSQKQR